MGLTSTPIFPRLIAEDSATTATAGLAHVYEDTGVRLAASSITVPGQVGAVNQVMEVALTAGATYAGNCPIKITANGMAGSPVTVSTALLATDTTTALAGEKIKTAMNSDATVGGYFTVTRSGATLIFTKKTQEANDPTMAAALVVDSATERISKVAHGYVNAQPVIFAAGSGALPTAISAAKYYFVVNKADDYFQVEETIGGGAVDLTTFGTLGWTVASLGKKTLTLSLADMPLYSTWELEGILHPSSIGATMALKMTIDTMTASYGSDGVVGTTGFILATDTVAQADKYSEITYHATIRRMTATQITVDIESGGVSDSVSNYTSPTAYLDTMEGVGTISASPTSITLTDSAGAGYFINPTYLKLYRVK